MAFFKLRRTEAERERRRLQKELERVAKAQRQHAAQQQKARAQQLKQQQKRHQQAVKLAKKASKTRIRLARKAEKQRARAGRDAPPFRESAGCSVCGKKFGAALHRRRHHCRQCRESCCLQCTSRTRRPVPQYGLAKPQKVCVVCETLVFATQADAQPREPREAVAALAASGRAPRRPHSAPLPPTEGVAVNMPRGRARARARSTKSKRGSIWTLPIRPLLKRKKSADNRKMDRDLQLEKRAMAAGRAIELQPQTAP